MPVLNGLKKVFILAFANKWSTFKLSLLQIILGFDEVFEFVVVKDLDSGFPILDEVEAVFDLAGVSGPVKLPLEHFHFWPTRVLRLHHDPERCKMPSIQSVINLLAINNKFLEFNLLVSLLNEFLL